MFSIVPKDSAKIGADVAAEAAETTTASAPALAAKQAAQPVKEDAVEEGVKPIEDVMPVDVGDGLGTQLMALARYMARSDVHTYAFSVAANAILSLFPFIVLLLTVCRRVFHSRVMEGVVADMMRSFLPTGQDFVIRNMQVLAHPKQGVQVFSLVMLLVSSTGVFLPLEVALNDVWGVKKNRSYLRNQLISLGLAFAVGVLAMLSVASTAVQNTLLGWVFFGHTRNLAYQFASHGAMKFFAGVASTLLFFLIYWVLPFRRVPARAVLPTAIIIGLLWEVAKNLYVRALPWLDFQAVYGPFYISVGLMMWAFLSGLLLLAGAHFSATRYTLRLAREAKREEVEREK
jgi:YihY family inner membrane protein